MVPVAGAVQSPLGTSPPTGSPAHQQRTLQREEERETQGAAVSQASPATLEGEHLVPNHREGRHLVEPDPWLQGVLELEGKKQITSFLHEECEQRYQRFPLNGTVGSGVEAGGGGGGVCHQVQF